MGINTAVLERLAALRVKLAETRSPARRRKRQPDIRVMFFPPSSGREWATPGGDPKSTGRLALAPQPRVRPWPGPRPD